MIRRSVIVCGAATLSALAAPIVLADGFGHVRGHEVSRLAPYQCHHNHYKAQLLAQLRLEVHHAVRANAPHAAVGPLKRITVLDSHDYHAWEFLSYTYAVLGDVASAANVDLDTVTLFEYVPPAAPQVSRAMSRLQSFDPRGWRTRIEAKRREMILHVWVEPRMSRT